MKDLTTNGLTFDEYQEAAATTAVYPAPVAKEYLLLGLLSEAGEIAGKYKKVLRGDGAIDAEAIKQELGDVLWYLSGLAREFGFSLEDVAEANLTKLIDRAQRGVIMGNGDKR